MSTYGPGAETSRRLVALLRADAALSDPTLGLLYSVEPMRDSFDYRVWTTEVQYPPDMDTTTLALPRVLLEVVSSAHAYEQEQDGILQGPVKVTVHTVAQKDREDLAERVDAYIATLLVSTWLSDARIIAARLSQEGDRRRVRIPVWNGAWQISSRFSTPNVGSLQ